MKTYYSMMESPLGTLVLTSDGAALTGIYMDGQRNGSRGDDWVEQDDAAPLPEARAQLREYFEGERTAFDLPLASVGSDFQRQVWQELHRSPYGATISYGELARRVGKPRAAQAVGAANGRNPLPIVVPCHRVIGADGSLVGYGGGLPRKQRLLALETGQQQFQ